MAEMYFQQDKGLKIVLSEDKHHNFTLQALITTAADDKFCDFLDFEVK